MSSDVRSQERLERILIVAARPHRPHNKGYNVLTCRSLGGCRSQILALNLCACTRWDPTTVAPRPFIEKRTLQGWRGLLGGRRPKSSVAAHSAK